MQVYRHAYVPHKHRASALLGCNAAVADCPPTAAASLFAGAATPCSSAAFKEKLVEQLSRLIIGNGFALHTPFTVAPADVAASEEWRLDSNKSSRRKAQGERSTDGSTTQSNISNRINDASNSNKRDGISGSSSSLACSGGSSSLACSGGSSSIRLVRPRPTLYADFAATGRAVKTIEQFLQVKVLPLYGNTHSQESATGRQAAELLVEARQIIKTYFNADHRYGLIFTGNGASAAATKFAQILILSAPIALAAERRTAAAYYAAAPGASACCRHPPVLPATDTFLHVATKLAFRSYGADKQQQQDRSSTVADVEVSADPSRLWPAGKGGEQWVPDLLPATRSAFGHASVSFLSSFFSLFEEDRWGTFLCRRCGARLETVGHARRHIPLHHPDHTQPQPTCCIFTAAESAAARSGSDSLAGLSIREESATESAAVAAGPAAACEVAEKQTLVSQQSLGEDEIFHLHIVFLADPSSHHSSFLPFQELAGQTLALSRAAVGERQRNFCRNSCTSCDPNSSVCSSACERGEIDGLSADSAVAAAASFGDAQSQEGAGKSFCGISDTISFDFEFLHIDKQTAALSYQSLESRLQQLQALCQAWNASRKHQRLKQQKMQRQLKSDCVADVFGEELSLKNDRKLLTSDAEELALQQPQEPWVIVLPVCLFLAASNVTGLLSPLPPAAHVTCARHIEQNLTVSATSQRLSASMTALNSLVHRFGGLSCWDCAGVAAHLPIDVQCLSTCSNSGCSGHSDICCKEGSGVQFHINRESWSSNCDCHSLSMCVEKGADVQDFTVDAVFFSPHKLLGGPGSAGVLVLKKSLMLSDLPAHPGGGSVYIVSAHKKTAIYTLDRSEHREEAGSPNLLAIVRAGAAIKLHQQLPLNSVRSREERFTLQLLHALRQHERIQVVGPLHPRVGIVSFLIKYGNASCRASAAEPDATTMDVCILDSYRRSKKRCICSQSNLSTTGGLYLHHNFVAAVLSDVFGLQSRAGCMCASPYISFLLSLEADLLSVLEELLLRTGQDIFRPGVVRISLHGVLRQRDVDKIIAAILWTASNAWLLLPRYEFLAETGEWRVKGWADKKRQESARLWISGTSFLEASSSLERKSASVQSRRDSIEQFLDNSQQIKSPTTTTKASAAVATTTTAKADDVRDSSSFWNRRKQVEGKEEETFDETVQEMLDVANTILETSLKKVSRTAMTPLARHFFHLPPAPARRVSVRFPAHLIESDQQKLHSRITVAVEPKPTGAQNSCCCLQKNDPLHSEDKCEKVAAATWVEVSQQSSAVDPACLTTNDSSFIHDISVQSEKSAEETRVKNLAVWGFNDGDYGDKKNLEIITGTAVNAQSTTTVETFSAKHLVVGGDPGWHRDWEALVAKLLWFALPADAAFSVYNGRNKSTGRTLPAFMKEQMCGGASATKVKANPLPYANAQLLEPLLSPDCVKWIQPRCVGASAATTAAAANALPRAPHSCFEVRQFRGPSCCHCWSFNGYSIVDHDDEGRERREDEELHCAQISSSLQEDDKKPLKEEDLRLRQQLQQLQDIAEACKAGAEAASVSSNGEMSVRTRNALGKNGAFARGSLGASKKGAAAVVKASSVPPHTAVCHTVTGPAALAVTAASASPSCKAEEGPAGGAGLSHCASAASSWTAPATAAAATLRLQRECISECQGSSENTSGSPHRLPLQQDFLYQQCVSSKHLQSHKLQLKSAAAFQSKTYRHENTDAALIPFLQTASRSRSLQKKSSAKETLQHHSSAHTHPLQTFCSPSPSSTTSSASPPSSAEFSETAIEALVEREVAETHAVADAACRRAPLKIPRPLRRTVGQAIHQFNMIKEGDSLLIGVSGGKDSLTLLHVLRDMQRRSPVRFSLAAATVDPMTPEYNPKPLISYMQTIGVTYHYLQVPIISLAKRYMQRQSICAFCSRLKRGILYSCMRRHKYNVLVLGQHLDDVCESFFMSALYAGTLGTMKAHYWVTQNDLRVCRPLIFTRERETAAFAAAMQLPVIADNCPACFAAPKERHRMKMFLSEHEIQFPQLFQTLLTTLMPLLSVSEVVKANRIDLSLPGYAACSGNSDCAFSSL